MDETFSTKIIILNRRSFRERDSYVVAYSRDKGKLGLVVRGTKSLKSKLVGHIEPLNAVDVMVARGKRYDYLAGASTRQAFLIIKSDVDRSDFAGRGINIFDQLVKEGEPDDKLYVLLFKFLEELNRRDISFPTLQLIYSSYLLKLFSYLGYSPVLDRCTACAKVAVGSSFLFDYKKGGIICTPCAHNDSDTIQMSPDIKKILQFVAMSPPEEFVYPPLYEAELNEFITIIDHFTKYHRPS